MNLNTFKCNGICIDCVGCAYYIKDKKEIIMSNCGIGTCDCYSKLSKEIKKKLEENKEEDPEDYIHYPEIFDDKKPLAISEITAASTNSALEELKLEIAESMGTELKSSDTNDVAISEITVKGGLKFVISESMESEKSGMSDPISLRGFDSGAIRDTNIGKLEYYGFLSPLVLKRFSEYMDKHRKLPDGSLRGSDNWKGLFGDDHNKICFDSLLRHLIDVWLIMDNYPEEARDSLEEALCAMSFNINAILLKVLKDKNSNKPEGNDNVKER